MNGGWHEYVFELFPFFLLAIVYGPAAWCLFFQSLCFLIQTSLSCWLSKAVWLVLALGLTRLLVQLAFEFSLAFALQVEDQLPSFLCGRSCFTGLYCPVLHTILHADYLPYPSWAYLLPAVVPAPRIGVVIPSNLPRCCSSPATSTASAVVVFGPSSWCRGTQRCSRSSSTTNCISFLLLELQVLLLLIRLGRSAPPVSQCSKSQARSSPQSLPRCCSTQWWALSHTLYSFALQVGPSGSLTWVLCDHRR